MRVFPLLNLRAQTGLILFAGLLSLVVVTFAVSLAIGDSIRQDSARLAQLESRGRRYRGARALARPVS